MGLFDFFRKSKTELSDEQEKWNKMWDLWAEKRADTPYAELMTYQSEINNGGHDQYFLNIENTGDLQKEMTALKTVLSEKLQKNLQDAYHAYRTVTDNESDLSAILTLVEGVVGAAYARYANMLANAWYTLIDETHTVGRPYVSQVSERLHERIRIVSAHFIWM